MFWKAEGHCSKNDKFSEQKLSPLSIGEWVTVTVPKVDRGPLDLLTIVGVIMDKSNGVIRVGKKDGIIKYWFP